MKPTLCILVTDLCSSPMAMLVLCHRLVFRYNYLDMEYYLKSLYEYVENEQPLRVTVPTVVFRYN
jgi:hypothetical protein